MLKLFCLSFFLACFAMADGTINWITPNNLTQKLSRTQTTIKTRVFFQNRFNNSLKIKKMRSSCTCLNVSMPFHDSLAINSTSSFQIVINVPLEKNKYNKKLSVMMLTDAPLVPVYKWSTIIIRDSKK